MRRCHLCPPRLQGQAQRSANTSIVTSIAGLANRRSSSMFRSTRTGSRSRLPPTAPAGTRSSTRFPSGPRPVDLPRRDAVVSQRRRVLVDQPALRLHDLPIGVFEPHTDENAVIRAVSTLHEVLAEEAGSRGTKTQSCGERGVVPNPLGLPCVQGAECQQEGVVKRDDRIAGFDRWVSWDESRCRDGSGPCTDCRAGSTASQDGPHTLTALGFYGTLYIDMVPENDPVP